MGAIRRAFRVKNAVRHPIHTATRPVRRAVRKAVVPRSVRKVSYKVRSVSTAVHNPVSTAVRSLDSDNWKKNGDNPPATRMGSSGGKSFHGASHASSYAGPDHYGYDSDEGLDGAEEYERSSPTPLADMAWERTGRDSTGSQVGNLLAGLFAMALAIGVIGIVVFIAVKFLAPILPGLFMGLIFGAPLFVFARFLSSSGKGE